MDAPATSSLVNAQPGRDLWLSIHPRWANAIVDGRKTVELRRRAPGVEPGATALLYATSPDCCLVATALVRGVVSLPLPQLWAQFGNPAAVTRAEFRRYFRGKRTGAAIELEAVRSLAAPVGLHRLRELGIRPAQGWRYLPPTSVERLLAETVDGERELLAS